MTSDNTESPTIVQLDKLPIELYALLKLEGIAQSGGQAKHFISEGLVHLNGEVETRKRKKIISGDRIQIADTTLLVQGAAEEPPATS